jgi:hypothetical protein
MAAVKTINYNVVNLIDNIEKGDYEYFPGRLEALQVYLPCQTSVLLVL